MNCSHDTTVRDTCGDIVCSQCGLVVDRDVFQASWAQTQHTTPKTYRYIDRVRRLSQDMSLPDSILERAASIIDDVPRATRPYIAAAVYAACLEFNVPRTEKEVARHMGISCVAMARYTSRLRREGRLPINGINAASMFGRLAQRLDGYDTIRLQETARSKYESRRHVYANICVDTLVTDCIRDAAAELDMS